MSNDRQIILIAHNLRSSHNVGSLLRTAEGLGITKVFLTGYTPYPQTSRDSRLPHIARKVEAKIRKTALGAESMDWDHRDDVFDVLQELRSQQFEVVAVEQHPTALHLPDFKPTDRLALLVGREVEGVEPEVLAAMDTIVEIPMAGQKESFNVVQAAAMALYHCTFPNRL